MNTLFKKAHTDMTHFIRELRNWQECWGLQLFKKGVRSKLGVQVALQQRDVAGAGVPVSPVGVHIGNI